MGNKKLVWKVQLGLCVRIRYACSIVLQRAKILSDLRWTLFIHDATWIHTRTFFNACIRVAFKHRTMFLFLISQDILIYRFFNSTPCSFNVQRIILISSVEFRPKTSEIPIVFERQPCLKDFESWSDRLLRTLPALSSEWTMDISSD